MSDRQVPDTYLVDLTNSLCVGCSTCGRMIENAQVNLGGGKYIADSTGINERQITTAVLPISDCNFADYENQIRGVSKGAALRQARKARREGIVCEPFDRRLHIPDIHEINTSMVSRSGGVMRQGYMASVEELGGAPDRHYEWVPPKCRAHYDLWWGAFISAPGYHQGQVQTDRKLIAYIKFRRIGSIGLYSMILGHGDYLKHGVMQQLHLDLVRYLFDENRQLAERLEYIMYAGYYQGGDGLRRWKKNLRFVPAYLQERRRPRRPVGRSPSARLRRTIRRLGRVFARD